MSFKSIYLYIIVPKQVKMFAHKSDRYTKNQILHLAILLSIWKVESKEFLINLHHTKSIEYDCINKKYKVPITG